MYMCLSCIQSTEVSLRRVRLGRDDPKQNERSKEKLHNKVSFLGMRISQHKSVCEILTEVKL